MYRMTMALSDTWAKKRITFDSTQGTIMSHNDTQTTYIFNLPTAFHDIVHIDWTTQFNLIGMFVSIAEIQESNMDSTGATYWRYISSLGNYEINALAPVLDNPKSYNAFTITIRLPPAIAAQQNILPTSWLLELVLFENKQFKSEDRARLEQMLPRVAIQNSQTQTIRPRVPTFFPAITRS